MNPISATLVLCAMVICLAGGCAAKHAEVRQYGRMHEVLSGRAAQARGQVSLSKVLERPHAVGVGALAGLQGEITIQDGQAWVARSMGGVLQVDGPSSTSTEQAALLTIAYVECWQDVPIGIGLYGEDLERFIGEQAGHAGIDQQKPFPFMIEGAFTDLQMHVIGGACPMRASMQPMSEQQPWRYAVDEPTRASVVGFYAPDSVGVMTHAGTSIHAHAILQVEGQEVTGHVEQLAVTQGAILKLPRP